MPYKSKAQRKYFHAAEKRGEIPSSTVKKYDKESKGKSMPNKKKGNPGKKGVPLINIKAGGY